MKTISRKKQGDCSRAIGYIRVSTTEQHIGPEAQRAAIERWANSAGVTVESWHYDVGVSGGSSLDERPGLLAALADIKARKAGILATNKRDRIARDVYVAATIERAVRQLGAKVVCADGVGNGDGASDAFMRTILDGAAEYERALIRGRTKAAMAVKIARGESTGTPRFGYKLADDGKSVVENPSEQATLREMLKMQASGLSYRSIRRSGLLSRAGRPFTLQSLCNILGR